MPDNSEITTQLIERLEQIQEASHLPLERRLLDTTVWYFKNRQRIPPENLKARLDFMEKTFAIFVELTAMLTDRVQQTENRHKSQSLWTPNGMSITGDLRRFG